MVFIKYCFTCEKNIVNSIEGYALLQSPLEAVTQGNLIDLFGVLHVTVYHICIL